MTREDGKLTRKEIAREFNIQLAFAYSNCSDLGLTGDKFEQSDFANQVFYSADKAVLKEDIEKVMKCIRPESERANGCIEEYECWICAAKRKLLSLSKSEEERK